MWIVRCDEIDATFHQASDEMDVAGQPVELGNDEGRLGPFGSSNGSSKLGSIRPASTLDFAELSNQRTKVFGKMPAHRPPTGRPGPGRFALGDRLKRGNRRQIYGP